MSNIIRLSDYAHKKAYKAEIDVAHDCPIHDFMAWVEKYGLSQHLIAAIGPGGGNPCFEITHPNRDTLAAALSDYHGEPVSSKFIDQNIYQ